MKKKLFVLLVICLVLMFALPTALFAGTLEPTYDTGETAQLKAFLNLDSTETGKTNGQQLNAAYDENDPSTWSGITWDESTSPYHAKLIYWDDSSLKGALNISNFTRLQEFCAMNNELSSLIVSGDTALAALRVDNNDLSSLNAAGLTNLVQITCSSNNLSQLTLTGCANLYKLLANNNKLAMLDLSDCVILQYLYLSTNELTSLNFSGTVAMKELDCSSNNLTSLDVHNQGGLNVLYCNNNKLTSLNVTGLDSLTALICNDNKLSGHFDATALTGLRYFTYYNNSISALAFGEDWFNVLIGYNNPTTTITTKMFTEDSSEQTFSANSGGYISFNMIESEYSIYLYSQPKENNVFVSYTADGLQISNSPIHYIDPDDPTTDDIIANFTAGLTSSAEDGTIYEGGRITLSPYYTGGTWNYGEDYFSANFTNPNNPVFKALQNGNTTITYTMPADTYTYEEPLFVSANADDPIVIVEEKRINYVIPALPDQNLTISMAVSIKESTLPQTGQDYTIPAIFMATGITGTAGILLANKRKKKNV